MSNKSHVKSKLREIYRDCSELTLALMSIGRGGPLPGLAVVEVIAQFTVLPFGVVLTGTH